MKTTHHTEPFEHEEYTGNDWTGTLIAAVVGLAVAIIIIELLFGDVLHYWIAELIV